MQEQEEKNTGRKTPRFSRQKVQELNQRSHITAAMHQQVEHNPFPPSVTIAESHQGKSTHNCQAPCQAPCHECIPAQLCSKAGASG